MLCGIVGLIASPGDKAATAPAVTEEVQRAVEVPVAVTVEPTETPVPPTATAEPTDTPEPEPTATIEPSATPIPPTATSAPTDTPEPSVTPVPPTATTEPPTLTPVPVRAVAVPLPTERGAPSAAGSDCDCSSGDTLNCKDFAPWDAQACYMRCIDLVGTDVHGLDGDNDGDACEWEW
jgi:hypothetical protein